MKPQLYRGVLRSGLAVILTGTLMVPTTAFASQDDTAAKAASSASNTQTKGGSDASKQSPEAGSLVEQVAAQASDADAAGTDDRNVTIIVQLEDGGTQGITPFSTLLGRASQDRHSYFKNEIRDMVAQTPSTSFFSADGQPDTPQFQELYDYYHAIDGFAIKAPESTLDGIKALDGVKNAFVEQIHEVPADEGAQEGPMNQTSLDMTGADEVDQKGDGQFVVIVDSGLDVNHEAFKGDLDDATVAETEADITTVKGQLNEGKSGRYVSEKIPFVYDYADHDADVDPGSLGGMDHGTHVAGIVAANAGDVRGTAPNAQIAMMKVAESATGGIPDSALLAAFDDAVVLAPDSVNVSLGADAGFSEAASQVYGDAINSLRDTGATVNVAAGNSYTSAYKNKTGVNLPYSSEPDSSIISSPSSLPSTVSVASINNNERTSAFLAADGTEIPYVDASNDNAWGSPLFNVLDDGTYEYVDGGIGSEEDAAKLKEAYPNGMDHKVAILVQRGGTDANGDPLTFIQKANNLESLSPYAVIFYDNIDTGLTSFAIDSESVTAIMVTKANGEKLLNAADKHFTKKKDLTTEPSLAPRMSDFSSWGPNTNLDIKPEVTAPGGNIYSTVPGNAYDYKSGTSMATPQMAGISALVHEYVNSDSKFAGMSDSQKSDVVTQLLMSTAKPVVDPMVDPDQETGALTYYSPRDQGAGLANVPAATSTPVYLTVEGASEQSRPKADLGESADGTWSFNVELHNLSDQAQSYTPDAVAMSEQIAEGLFLTLDQNWTGKGIDVSFGGDFANGQVTAPANGTATLTVNVAVADAFKSFVAENAANGAYVEGFAFLKAASESAVDLSVPYLGFYGDWDKQPAFDAVSGSGNEHMVGNALMNLATNKELGVNPLDSYGDADRSKAVVSNSAATDAPVKMQPFTTLMRNARTLDYDYVNADGQTVRNYSADFIPKTTYSANAGTYLYVEGTYLAKTPVFDGRDDNGNPLPDGTYTLKRTATLDTDDAVQQSLEQSFVYDTTKPVISNVQLTGEEGARTLTFDVTDGSWLAGLNFVGPDDDPSDPSAHYYQMVVGENNYDDSSISEPEEQADGTKVWHVSVPVSVLADEWGGWSGPGGDLPNTVPVYAWDYGANVSVRTDAVVNPVPATGMTLSSSDVQLAPGQTGALTATLEPADATQTALTWASSDDSVVTVDDQGNLQGVGVGTATVTATLADNPAISASATVTVAEVSDDAGIVLSQTSAQLLPDGTLPLTALVSDGFAEGGVEWTSSNENVVKVQQPSAALKQVNTQVSLVAQGQVGDADVTATVRKGDTVKTATIHVTVRPADYADFVIDEAGTLTGYTGSKTDVSIPNNVTAIADSVFEDSNIQHVSIPASVKTIGAKAFKSTHNLATVTFEQGSVLESVGSQAFYGTQGLSAIEFPASVKTVGDEVLSTSSVQRAVLPAGVTVVPTSAFENCTELTDLTLGDGVTEIGENAFNACTALGTLKVAGADGAATEGLPSALTSIGAGAFQLSGLAAATLPAGVTSIGDNAFAKAPLATLELNEGLQSIGAGAFANTSATKLVIPNSVTEVGAGAFTGMTRMAEATVGAQVPADQLIGAFKGDAALTEFKVADGAAHYSVVDGVLFNKDATQLVAYPSAKAVAGGTYAVPDGVTAVADAAFYQEMGASRVDFPDSLRTIGSEAFAGSAVAQVILPDAFETIGASAYAGAASLTYVNIGGATEIGERAFSRCPSLATLNLREDLNRLTTVGDLAFSDEDSGSSDDSDSDSGSTATYNGALQAVMLPDSVTAVGKEAFANLTGMTKAHIGAGLTSGGDTLFAGASSLASLTVSPTNTVYSAVDNVLYAQEADGLHLVSSAAASPTVDVVVQDGTVKIDNGAFRNNRVIKSVVLPEGLLEIGSDAFNTCDSLESVTFPDSLQTVGAAAFNWDLKLNFVEFGTQIKQLGDPDGYSGNSAFSGHLPTRIVVRGGVNGAYVTSTIQDETVQESAYFGPGITKLDFGGGGTVPKILVVPADLEELSFPWSIGDHKSDIRVYAPAGSKGYDVAKAKMADAGMDTSMQLKEYTPLSVTAAVQDAIEPGKTVNVKATATGGVDGDKEFRFIAVGADGSQQVVQDWSTADTYAWQVPANGSVPVVEVRDATWLSERATLGFDEVPEVTLSASGLVNATVGQAVDPLTAAVSAPEGATVTYQWYADGAAIDGATQASYQPATDVAGEHAYHVVATVIKGDATAVVSSDPVTVRVSEAAAEADTKELAQAVAQAEALVRSDYTPESWARFAAALAAARAQLAAPDSQEAVNAALKELTDAQAALEKPAVKPDTTALAAAVEKAQALAEADYTPESWAPFASALAAAQAELADPQSDESVKAALDALAKAQNELVKKDDGQNPKPENPDDQKPGDNTGDDDNNGGADNNGTVTAPGSNGGTTTGGTTGTTGGSANATGSQAGKTLASTGDNTAPLTAGAASLGVLGAAFAALARRMKRTKE